MHNVGKIKKRGDGYVVTTVRDETIATDVPTIRRALAILAEEPHGTGATYLPGILGGPHVYEPVSGYWRALAARPSDTGQWDVTGDPVGGTL